MAILAALCLAFGVLPTYVIPALGSALNPLAGAPPTRWCRRSLRKSRITTLCRPRSSRIFTTWARRSDKHVLPGRGLVVLHRGGAENPVVFAMSTSYMLVALIVLLLLTWIIIRLWLTRSRKLARRELVGTAACGVCCRR
jgi:hypothetical protein